MKKLFLAIVVAGAVSQPATETDAGAPAGRYMVPAAGTVFDTKTRLTWQQSVAPLAYTWTDAKTYCAGLGATLPGTGWRLPTIKEIQTIFDYSQVAAPFIDPVFLNTTASQFWTATPVPSSTPARAWILSFTFGASPGGDPAIFFSVRCVR